MTDSDHVEPFPAPSVLPRGWCGIVGEHARGGTRFYSLCASDGHRTTPSLPISLDARVLSHAWIVTLSAAWALASAPAAPREVEFDR